MGRSVYLACSSPFTISPNTSEDPSAAKAGWPGSNIDKWHSACNQYCSVPTAVSVDHVPEQPDIEPPPLQRPRSHIWLADLAYCAAHSVRL